MKFTILSLTLMFSASVFAYPMMSTKEKVRIELWVYGIEESQKKAPTVDKNEQKPLPIELEQAILKF